MSEFFCLSDVFSEQLLATVVASDKLDERVLCPVNPHHQSWSSRAQASRINPEVHVQVRHNKREQMIIWAWAHEHCLFHNHLLAQMQTLGFTGYSARPATVRFRDGSLSREYQRMFVTGWGGVARPESGIRLIDECLGCHSRRYSPLLDPSQLIDRTQWSGEDLFIVWPMPSYTFVTQRVAEFLRSLKVKSCMICSLEPAGASEVFTGTDGFRVGSLAGVLPPELATKYGKPLGII